MRRKETKTCSAVMQNFTPQTAGAAGLHTALSSPSPSTLGFLFQFRSKTSPLFVFLSQIP